MVEEETKLKLGSSKRINYDPHTKTQSRQVWENYVVTILSYRLRSTHYTHLMSNITSKVVFSNDGLWVECMYVGEIDQSECVLCSPFYIICQQTKIHSLVMKAIESKFSRIHLKHFRIMYRFILVQNMLTITLNIFIKLLNVMMLYVLVRSQPTDNFI